MPPVASETWVRKDNSMRDGMQVTWRGRIGPATLSKPEAMGSSEVSAQEEYESGAGRKVPRPSEQARQSILRGAGLKAQANDRSMRDKVVRGGGVKKKRHVPSDYKILSTRSIPQWGDTNVSLVGDGSDALDKVGASKAGGWIKGLFATPAVKSVAPPKPAGSAVPGGVESWKKFRKRPTALKAKAPKTPKAPKPSETPITQSKFQKILQQQQAVEADPLGVAEQQGMKVGPWAKIVNNPWGSMFLQMAAMGAIEPLMYGLGIRSPILGGVLPLIAMQKLPEMLAHSAKIPRLQNVLMRRAQQGRLNLGGQPAAPAAPVAPTPTPATGMVNTASVAIPRVTTVFG